MLCIIWMTFMLSRVKYFSPVKTCATCLAFVLTITQQFIRPLTLTAVSSSASSCRDGELFLCGILYVPYM